MKHFSLRSLIVASLVSTSSLTLLLSFQNCAKAGFDSDGSVTGLTDGELVVDPDTGVKSYKVSVNTGKRYPSDILFVVDESVSMGSIVSEVRAGFSSLSPDIYPENSKIAVTNMMPAYMDTGVINTTRSFLSAAYGSQMPGFMKLVTSSSIASFKSQNPTLSGDFRLPGCPSEWFSPTDKDSAGQACLLGASQIALQGTGVEAGIVSLKHLILATEKKSQKLFRSGASATVVFVSDTHDPGANYYGRVGAESSMPSYTTLRNQIYSHQPNLKGLKFNAIVPLPRASNALLQNVKVIGRLPQTEAEEQVSGEGTNGWSYLPFVAASGGHAMHVVGNNWATGIRQMAQAIGYFENPTLNLGLAAVKITKVTVNGVVLQASEYKLFGGGLNLQITRRAGWPEVLDVQVIFE